jgi:hypothetical protein
MCNDAPKISCSRQPRASMQKKEKGERDRDSLQKTLSEGMPILTRKTKQLKTD